MSRTSGEPYTAWHWSWRDDEAIWDDAATRGHLLGLLVTADMAWPATADIPAGVPEEVLALLVQRGYIEVKGHRYRVPSIDAWRARTRAQAAVAAAARWRGSAGRSAASSARSSAGSTATRQDSTEQDRQQAPAALPGGAPVLDRPFAELVPPLPGHRSRNGMHRLGDVLPDVVPAEGEPQP